MKDLKERKEIALAEYKKAKAEYSADFKNQDKFKKFCDAKRNCMLLGVRI